MSGLTAAQIELRRGLVGSSEIGAIVDFYAPEGTPRCDPYKTAQRIFNEKVLGAGPEGEEKRHQTWGLIKEPAILQFHAMEHGMRLVPSCRLDLDNIGEKDIDLADRWQTLVHPTLPVCATPDGIGERPNGKLRDIQAKNAQRFQAHRWGEPGTDDAPLLYVAQVTIELCILLQHEKLIGRIDDIGDLAVSLEGAPPSAYHIRYDPELSGGLTTLAAKFKRDHLDTKKPPKMDGSDDAAEYVRRRWETHVGKLKPWSEEAQALADIAQAQAEIVKAASEMREEARNKLKRLIGGASGVERLCTWKKAKDSLSTVTDWKNIAEDLALAMASGDHDRAADIIAPVIEAHTTTEVTKKGSRRLLFTKPNGQAEAEAEQPKEEAA